jgi:hypothetical protein
VRLHFFLCVFYGTSAFAADTFSQYAGDAYALKGGSLVYREQHFLRAENGQTAERVVLYSCPKGGVFARKLMRVRSGNFTPEFELDDARLSYREGLRRDASGVLTTFYKERAAAPEDSAPIKSEYVLVADAGFDQFVRQNWNSLIAGNSATFAFVVPSRLSAIRFNLNHVASESYAGEEVESFRLKLSGILGWIISGLDISYAKKDRVLMRFSGLSNVRDTAGENYKVRIEFPRAAIKSDANSAAFNSAKSVTLVKSCRTN